MGIFFTNLKSCNFFELKMHFLLDRSRPQTVSTPIFEGGQTTTTENDTPIRTTYDDILIGPEREYKMYSKGVRIVTSVYYVTSTFLFSSCLLVTLVLTHLVYQTIKQIVASLAKTKFKVNIEASDEIDAKFDYICGLQHEITALLLTKWLQLFIPITHSNTESYGLDDVELVISDNATIKEREDAENELEFMKIESKRNWWNRLTSLFGIEPTFCFSRGFFMVNHLSNIDGIIARGLGFPAGSKIMYKGALKRVPVLGWNFKLAKDIDIQFVEDTFRTQEGFKESLDNQINRLLAHRIPVTLFPEGGRSRYRRMAPFRRGMFKYAIEHNIPVWPSALYGTQDCMIVGARLLNPVDVKLMRSNKILFPYGHDVDSFMTAVRDEIQNLIRENIRGYDEEADRPMNTLEEFNQLEEITRSKYYPPMSHIAPEEDEGSLSAPPNGLKVVDHCSTPKTQNKSKLLDIRN